MRRMINDELRQLLTGSFYPPAAQGMDAVLSLVVDDQHALTIKVTDGLLQFLPEHGVDPDTTFRFADAATAHALLSGHEDAFQAFMAGRFRADGYLMWAFTLMAMFRSASLPVTPTE